MAADDIVVFLGPSLSAAEARQLLPARYLSPVRCGDVLRVRRLRPRAIAIIDGLFESISSVWHKEILLALEDGIAVFGASSMGALRAAELAAFGMVGIGAIFEAYRDGTYADDDEVALLHGPGEYGYPAMSEAMVNIRATVSKAIAERVIRPDSGERVIRCAKDTFYQERSLSAAIAEAWREDAHSDEPARFRLFLDRGGYVNQKRLDALALVRHLAGLRAMPVRPGHGSAEVHRSSFILKLQHDVMCGPFDELDADLPREERVAIKAAQLGPTFHLLQRLAKLMAVSHALARSRGIVATPQARARVYQHHDFGLGPAARTRRWADAHDLDAEACAQFVDRLSVIGGFLEASATRNGKRGGGRHLDAYLLTLMRLDDRYRAWRPRGAGTGARADRAVLRSAARRNGQEFGLYRRFAALWSAVDPIVVTHGIKPQGTPQVRSDEFRRARGLERQDATRAWQRANNLDANGYMTLVEQHARLSVPCDGTEARTLGLFHLTDPACWLLDAIRLTGHYVELKRRVYHGPAQPGPAGNRSRRNEMAKARTTKAAPKKAAVKDLAPKNPKAVKGGLLKKKVYE